MEINYFISRGAPQFKGLLPIFAADDKRLAKAFVGFGVPSEWKPSLIFGGVPTSIKGCHVSQHVISLENFKIDLGEADQRAAELIGKRLSAWLRDIPQLKRVGSAAVRAKGVWLWTFDYEVSGYEGSFQSWIVPQGSNGRAVLIAQLMESAK